MPSPHQLHFYVDKYCQGSHATKEQIYNDIRIFVNWAKGTPRAPRKPQAIPDNETGKLVKAFLASRTSQGLAVSSLHWYRQILTKFANTYPEIPKEPQPIESFIGNFQSSGERRHGIFRAIKCFYKFACDRLGWTANPTYTMRAPRRKPRQKVPLTLAQIKKLLEFPHSDPEVRLLLFVLADTGARIGEIVSLLSEDILDDAIRVNGKVGQRIIPISPQVRQMLLDTGRQGRIFPRSVFRYRRLISLAFRDAGVPGTAHLIRHSYAALWDGSDMALKTQGGWASWKMVEHYASGRRVEKAKEEHEKHGPIAKLYGIEANIPEEGGNPTDQLNQNGKLTRPTLVEAGIDYHDSPKFRILAEDTIPASWADNPSLIKAREDMLFFWHALLCNITRQLGRLFDNYELSKKVNSLNERYICLELVSEVGDKEALKAKISFVAEQFWRELSQLAKRQSATEYLAAAKYQDSSLLGGEFEVEDITLEPTPVLWERVKA